MLEQTQSRRARRPALGDLPAARLDARARHRAGPARRGARDDGHQDDRQERRADGRPDRPRRQRHVHARSQVALQQQDRPDPDRQVHRREGRRRQNSASMPAASTPHLRTKEDKAGGVEGGYLTDVLHENFGQHAVGDRAEGPGATRTTTRAARRSSASAARRRPRTSRRRKLTTSRAPPARTQPQLRLRDGGQGRRQPGHLRRGEVGVQASARARSGRDALVQPTAPRPRSTRRWSATATSTSTSRSRSTSTSTPTRPAAGEDAKFAHLIPYLTQFPDVHVRAEGFADLRGSATHNLGLAAAPRAGGARRARGARRRRRRGSTRRGRHRHHDLVRRRRGHRRRTRRRTARANRRVMLTFTHVPAGARARTRSRTRAVTDDRRPRAPARLGRSERVGDRARRARSRSARAATPGPGRGRRRRVRRHASRSRWRGSATRRRSRAASRSLRARARGPRRPRALRRRGRAPPDRRPGRARRARRHARRLARPAARRDVPLGVRAAGTGGPRALPVAIPLLASDDWTTRAKGAWVIAPSRRSGRAATSTSSPDRRRLHRPRPAAGGARAIAEAARRWLERR